MPRTRPHIDALAASKIRDIAHAGMGRDDVIALWFGESDEPTPAFIREAAKRALDESHTFYPPNRGIPGLTEALARYMTELHGQPIGPERITVSASAMNAIMLTMELLVDAGDNVVVATPLWPNCAETVHIMGGETRRVQLALDNGRWRLDLDRLLGRCDERTAAIFLNSPGNPTGWVMDRDSQAALLGECRRRGITIIADEVYERLCYVAERAPSFLDLADPDDPVIAINSFSKSWSMTGWRLGWITHPPGLGDKFGKLTEYNIAGPASFVQHAGITAVRDGDRHIAALRERYRSNRDLVCERLGAWPRVRLARPDGAFYAFLAVDGVSDSVALARDILARCGVGVAPGAAFGPEGEGWLRLCFGVRPQTLVSALDRLATVLGPGKGVPLSVKPVKATAADRKARSAAALRQNLKRRKQSQKGPAGPGSRA